MIQRTRKIAISLLCLSAMTNGMALAPASAVLGVYQGRARDDSIYAFDVDGVRRTYRCSFCPFYFKELTRGDTVTIYASGSVVTAIESPGGQIWSEKSVRSRRWLRATGVILAVILPMMILNHFAKRKARR